MKLKPTSRRAIRALSLTGVAVASVSSLVLTQAPAMADPAITYLAAGSDTTQDVMNQMSNQVAGNLLGSFDAVNPVSQNIGEIITAAKTGTGLTIDSVTPTAVTQVANPTATCSFVRPNGSGQGNAALRESMGSAVAPPPGQAISLTSGTTTLTGNLPAVAPGLGCVDIARSSSGPASTAVNAAGLLIYIPFALDAVTTSVGSGTDSIVPPGSAPGTAPVATPATNLTGVAAAGFSLATLQTMYSTGNDGVLNGTTGTSGTCYAPTGGPDGAPTGFTCTTTVKVDLYVPQSGSGTRSFWLNKMNITGALPAWVFDKIQSDGGLTPTAFVGATVEEHNGTAVSADPNGMAPFSVSQFIAQHNGHNPRFHQAVLMPISGVAPTTGAGVGTLNTAFPVIREVYNVAEYDRVVNTNPTTGPNPFDANLANLLVGPSSQVCSNGLVIQAFGFAQLSSAPLGHTCGAIDTTNLRAFPATAF